MCRAQSGIECDRNTGTEDVLCISDHWSQSFSPTIYRFLGKAYQMLKLFQTFGALPMDVVINRLCISILYTATFRAMGHLLRRSCCPLYYSGVLGN
jgi:hypothetical protein